MSVLIGEAELREQLIANSEEFRRLAAEHQAYENQLEKLCGRQHLNEAEKLQEVTLKKKKLFLKDRMYLMLQKYRKEMESGS